MDIAAELQQEAIQRAGSHEGFQQVIRLVLEDVERGETRLPSFYGESPLKWSFPGQCESRVARPEWTPPEQYLPIFHEYVSLMQSVLFHRKMVDDLNREVNASRHQVNQMGTSRQIETEAWYRKRFAEAQMNLSDVTHAARRKARELPIHAFKRLRAIEVRLAPYLGGIGNIYNPTNWNSALLGKNGNVHQSLERGETRWRLSNS